MMWLEKKVLLVAGVYSVTFVLRGFLISSIFSSLQSAASLLLGLDLTRITKDG